MTLRYEVTEQDYIDFNTYHYKASKMRKITHTILIILGVVLLALIALLAVLYIVVGIPVGAENPFPKMVVPLILLLALFVVIFVFEKPLMNLLVKSQLHAGKRSGYPRWEELELQEDCIVNTDALTVSRIPYANIEKFVLHNAHCYIYIETIRAFVFPLSALQGPEQQARFFAILKQHTGLDPISA